MPTDVAPHLEVLWEEPRVVRTYERLARFARVVVSELVLGSGLSFEERGSHTLKGVPGTWPLSCLSG